MSTVETVEGVGSNADNFPSPDASLLKPHLDAKHDLIPLHKPGDRKASKLLGKAPRDTKWLQRSYAGQDPRAWMRDGFNVGVRLHHGQVVLDIDPRNFNGQDDVAALAKRFGFRCGDFPGVSTGGGGFHRYMAKPVNLRIREKIDGLPGIEFKTAGRQLVAAGSVHPQTKQFYRADDIFSELAAPPMAPANLLDALARDSGTHSNATAHVTNEKLRDLLEVLTPIDFRDYDRWLRLMMACHHATGAEGVDEFVAWSILDDRYAADAEKIREKWQTLSVEHSKGVTARTLFRAVVDAGHGELIATLERAAAAADFGEFPSLSGVSDLKEMRNGRPAPSYANCLRLIDHANLGLAYDELARRYVMRAEVLPWPIDMGRELNDDTLRIIRRYLIEAAGMEFSKENVTEACLTVARQAPFNPVIEYLDGLNWDGISRIDGWLIRYLGAPDNEYVRGVGRLVLVAAARRARKPGCKFDQVVILEGAQGTGKSSALKVLGGEWYSDAELGRLDSKEAPIVLQGVWIHELGELTAMNRSEVEDLKAFVSRFQDGYRAPYERTPRSEPRRCIFIGTTNSESYLQDLSGNRRFWPVATREIDLKALERDRDQLWAEAAHAEAAGASIELPHHLWTAAGAEQAERLADDPWADRVRLWLDGELSYQGLQEKTTTARRDRVHSRELLESALGIEPARQNQHMAKRLRNIMRLIGGWTYKRSLRIDMEGNAAGYQRDSAEESCGGVEP